MDYCFIPVHYICVLLTFPVLVPHLARIGNALEPAVVLLMCCFLISAFVVH